MKFKMKVHADDLLLAAAAVAFFFVYSFLPMFAPARFNSPDEMANAFFSRTFAQNGSLWDFDALNLVLDGAIHPRSVNVVDDMLVPGGFIGLPVIYGVLTKVVGAWSLPFWTPLLAAAVAIFFGLTIRKFFGRRTGTIATLLLMANPVWWYGASRTLYPNTLFAALVIGCAWFMLAAPIAPIFRERPRAFAWLGLSEQSTAAFAGLLFGLALAVRPVEAYWLAPSAAILVIFGWRGLTKSRLAVFAAAAFLALLPFLWLNRSLYGHWLNTGYGSAFSGASPVEMPGGWGARILGPVGPYLFPLGFAPRDALKALLSFGLGFFWWWTALVGAALAALAVTARSFAVRHKPWPRPAVVYAVVFAVMALWLVPAYGSYRPDDTSVAGAVTIGSSYFRYWLPLFVLSVLPVAWLIDRLLARQTGRWGRVAVVAAAFVVIVIPAKIAVFLSPAEGLLAVRQTLIRNDREISRVLELTEPDSVIICDQADKQLFPERRVITPLRSDATWKALAKISTGVKVYYYGVTFPEKDFDYLNGTILPPLGWRAEPVETFAVETLYVFRPLEAPKP